MDFGGVMVVEDGDRMVCDGTVGEMTQSDDAGGAVLPARISCPFVYANGRVCVGHVVRVEAYKADMDWSLDAEGVWHFGFRPRSHFHVFCSEKGNHAGFRRQDSAALKFGLIRCRRMCGGLFRRRSRG